MPELNTLLVKKQLKETNTSMRELAKETAINVSTISRILNGQRKATLNHIHAISNCLNIPISELLTMEQNKGESIAQQFHNIRVIIENMGFSVKEFTFTALQDNLHKHQLKGATEKGRTTILNDFKAKLSELSSQGPLIEQLKSMFQSFKENAGTKQDILLIGGALLYFITSTDMIPDYLFPVGFLDDGFVVQYVAQSLTQKE
ncbi:helix-turn-helix domain-containing protein [Gracilibacillus caseinilyticus]|uniref:Helix-turn-helix domain-containing protein n=1 Tax=Gracilibacillus caseinilyticus TaxID=2932256 RepID=A0ABY4F2V3_9BACI|nr:helix-turn-helix domain-containing protein [Gracilibacillus caseinilyticus]UOQ50403.1 helix-turn-helix domain-containing protein [Gracilibacillus caseinilyticus]